MPSALGVLVSTLRRRRGWLLLLAGLALVALVRVADPFGDRGMTNVVSALVVVLLALGSLAAFALRREVPLRRRLGVVGTATVAVALLALLVRVDGVSAEMVPELSWRFGARPAARVAAPRAGSATLAPPSSHDFPGFLGARRDNRVEGVELAADWNARPPRLRWRRPIGAGWSAFALAGGLALTLEQDERGQHATARELAGGAVVWSTRIEEPFAHVLGGDGPRATPEVALTADGWRVYVQGAWGTLACLDAATGAVIWSHDLVSELGSTRAQESERAQYGRSSSPLLAGGLVVAPGGLGDHGAGLLAFDAESGEPRWRSPPRNFSYASPALATLAGIEQVLAVNEDTASGHALADGRLLWEHPWPGTTSGDASASQPVPLPPDRVLLSKGYGGGGALLALEPSTDDALALVPRVLWHDRRILRTKLTNVAVLDGHVYALDEGTLECVELASGAKRWKEGRYGHGQILAVGERLLVGSEDGAVSLVEANPERPNAVLGTFQALEGKSWAHLALADGLLVLRNAEECAAWELPLAE